MSLKDAAYSPENFRKEAHALVDYLADYLTKAYEKEIPAIAWEEPSARKEKWRKRLADPSDFMSLAKAYVEEATHLHQPGYAGHQVPAVIPLGALTDLTSGLLNTGLAVYEMSPVGTPMELLAVEWLLKKVGFPDGMGFLTSGGTLGNLTALLAARQKAKVFEKGAILVSDQAHYSIERASLVMGWGKEGVFKVKTDKNFRITSQSAQEALTAAKASGRTPIALVANCGSTATGSFDPLDEIAAFCKANNLWLHIDGAHGASVVLSKKYGALTKGIEQANSVVWDIHKLLFLPSLSTAVLFRDKAEGLATFSQEASYLFQKNNQEEWFNLGQVTFECTKRDLAFRLMATKSVYGEKLFEELIDGTFDLARAFAQEIKNTPGFELAIEPSANIVCFRYGTSDDTQDRIRAKILADGNFYLVRTKLPTGVYLRTTIMNPMTTLSDLKSLLQSVVQASRA